MLKTWIPCGLAPLAYAIQLSTLVMDGKDKLGAVTLTLRVPRSE